MQVVNRRGVCFGERRCGRPSLAMTPDIVLLGADWKSRTLIRAQLLEEGYDVVATDEWSTARRVLQSDPRAKMMLLDLEGLAEPVAVLREAGRLIDPDRVLVLGGLGTVAASEVESLGFRVLVRPFAIGDIVTEITRRLGATARGYGPD